MLHYTVSNLHIRFAKQADANISIDQAPVNYVLNCLDFESVSRFQTGRTALSIRNH